MAKDLESTDWQAVLARSLAYIALHQAELGNSKIGDKALFLEGLGMSRADVAAMLGTSTDSLGHLIKSKGKKRGRRGKTKD